MKNSVRDIVKSILQEVLSDKIWYHGTPDVRNLEEDGGFTQKYLNINYVEDIDEWDRMQNEMKIARESGDEDRYFEIINSVGNLRKNIKIKKPVFLTDTYSIAKTYADPRRAFDYQEAREKVLKVKVKDGRGVVIAAPGQRFRFIDIGVVRSGFINAGINAEDLDLAIRKLNFATGVKHGIKTDDIAALGEWFDFDYIDVVGVLDSYEGGNTKSTVRMVFNPLDIKIV